MIKTQPKSTLRQLRALFSVGTVTGLSDRELLERYHSQRADSAEAATAADLAFATLVDRHGAMVWGVCHRVLRDVHQAEDAFQATFLILVRKAGSVWVEDSLGRWLYGVAHRVAHRARTRAGQRESHVPRTSSRPPGDPALEAEIDDLRKVLDEELDRLPAKYRCPVELCHVQGLTYDQAARQLNWPIATVKGRLTRGRLRLRERLARRGLAPATVVTAMAFAREARSAVSQSLIENTVRVACTGRAVAYSAGVIELVDGALKMMAWNKLKVAAAGMFVALGVGYTAHALAPKRHDQGFLAVTSAQAGRQAAAAPDELPKSDRRWIRSLPNGATIEVIGVSSIPAGAHTWWQPDGTPLQPAPSDRTESNGGGDKLVPKSIVVRVTAVPEGADLDLSIAEARGLYRGPARRDAKDVPGLTELIGSFPAGTRTATLRFQVASVPWRTEVTTGTSASASGGTTGSYIFGDAIATRTGTSLAVTHNVNDMGLRVLAVDVNGQDHAGGIRASLGVTGFQQIKVEFDLSPEKIRHFLLQTRPNQKLEIPRIALEPEPRP
jgi:RNA polymerase sigma factor (sigma-70 family)